MAKHQQKTILIVDNDCDLCEMVGALVAQGKHKPILAYDEQTAVEMTIEQRPDAVLVDALLGDRDGHEVCKALKLRRDTNLIPIIVQSAVHEGTDQVRGVRVEADFYLAKPFQNRQLLECLNRAFKWAEQRQCDHVCASITLAVESDLCHLDEIGRMMSKLFADTPLTQQDMQKIKYAVLEMGHNAIEWGNKSQPHLAVILQCTQTEEKLTFVVRDQGEGFDPSDLPHAAKPDDPLEHLEVREKLGLREGGFGILLSKEFMDEISYNDIGNEVTLVKYLPPAKVSASVG